MATTRPHGQAPSETEVPSPHPPWLRALIAFLLTAGFIATLTVLWAETDHSQPRFLTPQGAYPPPQELRGRPSGRQGPAVLALAGDAMLGRGINKRLSTRPDYDPWRALAPALEDVDLFALNLECAITAHEERWPGKSYNFRLSPDNATRALGGLPLPEHTARYASTANNHALDYGSTGLADSLAALRSEGWAHSGAGASAERAQRAALLDTAAGVRVGILSVGDHCSCPSIRSWMATDAHPGGWYANLSAGQWDHLLAAVAKLDGQVDIAVVSLHAGPNYTQHGAPRWLRRLGRALVEAGADVVVAHSAHQILPVEVIDGKHVFYGLGDLLHDYPRRSEFDNDLGLLAKLYLEADGSQRLDLLPFRIHDKTVHPLPRGDPGHAAALRRAQWPPERSEEE